MPIRRSRPEPTGVPGIRQDGPGRFLVCVTWIDPRTGRRRKREVVTATLAEAVTKKEELKGSSPTESVTRQRFDDFGVQWMQVHGHRLAPSTRERYAEALAHATVPLGDIFADALQPADIRLMVSKQLKRGYAPTTVNARLRVLRVVLDDLVEDGVLPTNPARVVKAVPEGRTRGRRGRALLLDEFRLFISTVQKMATKKPAEKKPAETPTKKQPSEKTGKKKTESRLAEDVARLLLTAAWTGMRRGEILALRWEDYVDGELRVERSVWRRQEKSTKTDDPRRIVVVKPLAEALAEQRRWLVASQHPGLSSGLVFPANPLQARAGAKRRGTDEVSWYRSPTIFKEPLRKVVDAAGITDISAHSLRRTWENLMREAGVDQLVRRALAGWRSEKAQAIYATVAKEERDAAGEAVVRLVLEGRS